jgi:hypothetical protein
VPSSGVGAVIGNVTATDATQPGFVTVYPAATNRPLASNLNVERLGQTIPNLAVARLGYSGRVSMYSLTDVQLLFDVAGWFTASPRNPRAGCRSTRRSHRHRRRHPAFRRRSRPLRR